MKMQAHAKLNLFLGIKGVYDDGYHELSTVMHRISIWDDVTVEASNVMRVRTNAESIPDGEGNIAAKAAKLYGCCANVRIFKRIPAGAGMGGGSADAAAVLRALNEMHGLYEQKELEAIALKTGADVPFMLNGKTALCRGRGEVMTPAVCAHRLWFVVAMGENRLLTPDVYRAYDRLVRKRTQEGHGVFGISLSNFNRAEKLAAEERAMLNALAEGNVVKIAKAMRNDLEEAAVSLQPEVWETKCRLMDSGAVKALMTGSGAACFGLYEDEDRARRGAELLSKDVSYAVACCSEL